MARRRLVLERTDPESPPPESIVESYEPDSPLTLSGKIYKKETVLRYGQKVTLLYLKDVNISQSSFSTWHPLTDQESSFLPTANPLKSLESVPTLSRHETTTPRKVSLYGNFICETKQEIFLSYGAQVTLSGYYRAFSEARNP
ncbi:MAG: hypothetical protein LBM69_10250, partial [Lachnospiraceae bacterium]|nr:hypothetical protein [Lachnospiraceae bacterium]